MVVRQSIGCSNNDFLIVTTQRHDNFGTFLQCYALQHYIETLGLRGDILDYFAVEYEYPLIQKLRILFGDLRRNPKKYVQILCNSGRIIRRKQLYNDFRDKYFHLTNQKFPTYSDVCKYLATYSIYVAGSDQIWNPRLRGFRDVYFLKFAPEGSKRISYASSFGIDSFTDEELSQVRLLLNGFNSISCRETSGVDFLAKAGYKAVKVLDPTFLLPSAYWRSISDDFKRNIYKGFVLSYFLSNGTEKRKAVYSRIKKNQTVDITADVTAPMSSLLAVGPAQFLRLVESCSLMITDSFHGVVFSIIFRKDFYAMPRHQDNKDSQNVRIIDLLEELGLTDRWCPDYNLPKTFSHIDYNPTGKILKRKIDLSKHYLKQALCIG